MVRGERAYLPEEIETEEARLLVTIKDNERLLNSMLFKAERERKKRGEKRRNKFGKHTILKTKSERGG
jgi:hypothetical protein